MKRPLALLAVALLCADVALKLLVSSGMQVVLIPRVLTIGLVGNPNLAFGVPAAFEFAIVLHLTLFLIVAALAVSRLILGIGRGYWLLLIAVAGGLNLADRFIFGAVRDYLVFNFPFPIFNFADLAIMVGVLGFMGTFEWQKKSIAEARYVVPR
jgi:lipoprotein signal peptidase